MVSAMFTYIKYLLLKPPFKFTERSRSGHLKYRSFRLRSTNYSVYVNSAHHQQTLKSGCHFYIQTG